MAEVVTKLVVNSQEYDNKIKRAAEGLQHYAEECKKAGGTLEYADEEALAFARDLGKMETVATSARQKMREYTDAITGATAMYRQMSDEEKKGEFGRSLSASIDQLKAKAAQLKDVMADTNIELKNLASDTNFTEGLSLMTRTVGSCAAAITAWTGDSKEMEAVIKDLAKIGATVAAVDSLTKAFQKQNLVLLKNPYVAAAAGAVALAVALGKLYKSLHEVSAAEKDVADAQAKGRENAAKEITRIDALNNILHDNSRSMEERKTALQEIQTLVPNYHGALTDEGNLINDNTEALSDYVTELQRAATAQAAFDRMVEINKQKLAKQVELKSATANSAQASQAYQDYLNSPYVGNTGSSGVGGAAVGSTLATEARVAQNAVDDIQDAIDEYDAELQALQGLIDGSTLRTGTKAKKGGRGSAKSSGSGFGLANYLEMPAAGSLADLERQAAMVQASMKNATTPEEYKEMQDYLDIIIGKMKELKGEIDITFAPGSMNDLQQQLREAQANLNNITPGTEEWAAALADVQAKQQAVNDLQAQMAVKVKETADSFELFKDGVGAIGSLVGAMDNLKNIGDDLAAAFSGEMDAWDSLMTVFESGIGIMETVVSVIEAIKTLEELSISLSQKKAATKIAEATTVASAAGTEAAAEGAAAVASGAAAGANAAEASSAAGKAVSWIPIVGPILAVAAIAAVLGSTLAAISQAKSSGKGFAAGGIVPGNSFSGDNLHTADYGINSGELILNRAQQNSIAGQLQGGNQGGQITGTVTGANIYLALANFAKQNNKLAGSTTGGLVLKIE